MGGELTPIIERDGEWFIAQCPELPGANGQGKNVEECLNSFWEAVGLIVEDRNNSADTD